MPRILMHSLTQNMCVSCIALRLTHTHTHTCTDSVQHNKDAKHKEERGEGEGRQESWVTATSGGDALATLSLIGTRPA